MWVFLSRWKVSARASSSACLFIYFSERQTIKKKHTFVGETAFFCVFSLRARRAAGLNYQEAHTHAALSVARRADEKPAIASVWRCLGVLNLDLLSSLPPINYFQSRSSSESSGLTFLRTRLGDSRRKRVVSGEVRHSVQGGKYQSKKGSTLQNKNLQINAGLFQDCLLEIWGV